MEKQKKRRFKQNRKAWFRAFKCILKCRYKKVDFVYLGKKPTNASVILSNHEGTDGPLSLEIYADFPLRAWGAYEMNSGLIKMYKYQTRVYYHEKKHWNIHLARLFCLLASPLTNIFYKGLKLISVYKDIRLKKTLEESYEAIKNGENIVINPEVSDEGYVKELKGFHGGFVLLCQNLYKMGIDVDIYTAYLRKNERIYVFDKPYKFSEIKALYPTRQQLCDFFVQQCNMLGKMDLTDYKKN